MYLKMAKSRYRNILEGAAAWGAYYRNNPDIFVRDYLHIQLRLFQRLLVVMMFHVTVAVVIGARGIGKTFLSAIYCVTRAVLYPGTAICLASGNRGQASLVIAKIIEELEPRSPELRAEINQKETKVTPNIAQVVFNNGSIIKVVTASDSARGNRANVLLIDEYRLVDKRTIDDILRKFLTLRRTPQYSQLTDEERKREYDKEKNLTLYLSSAYFKNHWSYLKCIDAFKAMVDDRRKQFVCGFPYQLSVLEGLLDPELVADEMAETDFSDVKFSMEMDALWYGSNEDAFFDFDTISKNRKIKYPMLPDRLSSKVRDNVFKIPPKQPGEIRILSADIALMSSRKNDNDATSIFINQMIPTKSGRYVNNIVFPDSSEGLRTDAEALEIRQYYDEYACDYLVIDANGLGLGVVDCLMSDIVNPETGEIYPALSCCNNPEMASRCTDPYAPKVIWAIKASAQFNSDCAFLLREGFRSGRIRLLQNEIEAEEILDDVAGYKKLSPIEQAQLQMPYIHTTLLIDELVNLQHEMSGDKIKVYEKHGMRKDRYSSLSYNYYVAVQLEQKLNKQRAYNTNSLSMFAVKPPRYRARER